MAAMKAFLPHSMASGAVGRCSNFKCPPVRGNGSHLGHRTPRTSKLSVAAAPMLSGDVSNYLSFSNSLTEGIVAGVQLGCGPSIVEPFHSQLDSLLRDNFYIPMTVCHMLDVVCQGVEAGAGVQITLSFSSTLIGAWSAMLMWWMDATLLRPLATGADLVGPVWKDAILLIIWPWQAHVRSLQSDNERRWRLQATAAQVELLIAKVNKRNQLSLLNRLKPPSPTKPPVAPSSSPTSSLSAVPGTTLPSSPSSHPLRETSLLPSFDLSATPHITASTTAQAGELAASLSPSKRSDPPGLTLPDSLTILPPSVLGSSPWWSQRLLLTQAVLNMLWFDFRSSVAEKYVYEASMRELYDALAQRHRPMTQDWCLWHLTGLAYTTQVLCELSTGYWLYATLNWQYEQLLQKGRDSAETAGLGKKTGL